MLPGDSSGMTVMAAQGRITDLGVEESRGGAWGAGFSTSKPDAGVCLPTCMLVYLRGMRQGRKCANLSLYLHWGLGHRVSQPQATTADTKLRTTRSCRVIRLNAAPPLIHSTTKYHTSPPQLLGLQVRLESPLPHLLMQSIRGYTNCLRARLFLKA